MKLQAAPGIAIIEIVKDDNQSSITLTSKLESRILKGRVIEMGPNLITDLGALLEGDRYASVGDVVCFLSYEGNYDNITLDGQKYYIVKFQDLRGIIT